MLDLGILDYIFLGLVALGGVLGILRGILKELYLFSAFILAFLASVVLSLPVTLWVGQKLAFYENKFLVSFLIIFVASMILLNLILNWVTPNNKDKEIKLNWKSRIFGFLFGLIHGVLYVGFASWILMQQSFIEPETLFSGAQKFYPRAVEILMFFSRFYQ